jgi:hypothetical protein
MSKVKSNFYVYFLRRPDKEDPLVPGLWQPFYVGKGHGKRVNSHRKEAENLLKDSNSYNPNVIKNSIIHKLWNQDFDFIEEVVIANISEEDSFYYEMEAITAYGRIDLGTGCLANLTNGGEGSSGYLHTEEALEKMSIAQKIRLKNPEDNPFYNKHHDEETKQVMSTLKLGIPLTEEHKQNLRGPRPNSSGENHWAYGKTPSEETRRKQSVAMKGKPGPNKGKSPSEETRRKQSESMSGEKNPNYGKPLSEEQKIKLSESLKGREAWNKGVPWSDEIKSKISESNKGRPMPEEQKIKISEANSGKVRTEETKKKMSIAFKGRPAPNKGKPMSEEQKIKISESNKLRNKLKRWDKVISEYINQFIPQGE